MRNTDQCQWCRAKSPQTKTIGDSWLLAVQKLIRAGNRKKGPGRLQYQGTDPVHEHWQRKERLAEPLLKVIDALEKMLEIMLEYMDNVSRIA